MSNNRTDPQNTEFLDKFLSYLNRDQEVKEITSSHPSEIKISEQGGQKENKAVISFVDLSIDLDKFEGFSDEEIIEHLQRVGTLATAGQLREVIGMHPTYPYEGSKDDLVRLYIQHTMKIILSLRSL